MNKLKANIKKILDVVLNPRYTTSLQDKNEIQANSNLSFCLFIFSILIIFLYLCIFFLPNLTIPTDTTLTYIILIPIIYVLMLCSVIWPILKGTSNKYYKYLLIALMFVAVTLCSTIIGSIVNLIWCIPLVFVMHYYNPKISRNVYIISVILMIITTFTVMFFGIWDSNMMGGAISSLSENTVAGRAAYISSSTTNIHPVFKTLLFVTLPTMLILTITYLACNKLSVRTQELSEDMMNSAITNERLSSEFNIASKIQNDALPRSFPADKRIDVYAKMTPAKKVGGDFYDFFYIDDNHFAFLVADTSGKGVPAAMFMMKAKTLLQALSLSNQDFKKTIENANKQLCLNNDSFMFVTSWIGVINVKTGKISYINAGHNYPVIKRKTGEVEFLKNKPNCFFGVKHDALYDVHSVDLNDGDKLLLYTDGVNEAENENLEFYGNDRLLNFVKKDCSESSKDFVNGLYEDVKEFSHIVEQTDDITLLAITYNSTNEKYDLNVTSQLENGEKVISFINNLLSENNTNHKTIMEIDTALDEVFSNVAKYAYSPNIGDISISAKIDNNRNLSIVLTDSGRPFNPLKQDDPKFEDYKSFNRVGGLGIFITKRVMDDVQYQYIDNKNILVLTKKI